MRGNWSQEKFYRADGQSGAAARGIVVVVLAITVAMGVVWYMFGTIVPIGHVGVRKIAFGPGQGLSARGLQPGYHWTVPGYSTVYLIPATRQLLHFDRDGAGKRESLPPLDVPTVDGTSVEVDATVVTQFFSGPGEEPGVGKHGGPADLIHNVGVDRGQWIGYLSQIAENELKRALGSLSTADFYNPTKREEKVREAERQVQARLAPVGIRVDGILLRRYTYRDEIDLAIFKKNLQELEGVFNRVASEFAGAQRDVNQVISDGDVKIQSLDRRGLADAEKLRSEGDLYRRQKMAEADQKVAEAKAEVDTMRSKLLSQVGGDTYVALQMAKILGSLKGGVVTDLDPYDFDGWISRLTGSSNEAVQAPTADQAEEKS
jgi:SPFH domain / Band 7 family